MASMFLNRNLIGDFWFLIGEKLGESTKRYCCALLTGLLVTASLFFLMQSLISGSDIEVTEPTAAANLTFVRLVEDRDVIVDDPKLEPPPVPEVQPATKLVIPVSPGGRYDEIGPRDVPPPFSHQVTVGVTDGGILPVVTVAPTYPRRMAARGIEGWVLLEFSVDQLGRVQNPQVIDARPTGGFSKAAIDAVLRYKYKPKVFDGKAAWVHGVQTRMVFQLDNG